MLMGSSCMPKITQTIVNFIDELKKQNIKVKFCDPFLPLPQHGQVSKLIAGLTVQNYLYQSRAHSEAPLPINKNHFFNTSLRQRAKQQIHSQVGEVFGADQMKKVFDYHDYETQSYRILDKATYERFLLTALDQNQPVIVYYDEFPHSDDKAGGDPGRFNGHFEHAAVIVGYYYRDNDLYLIASHSNDFYVFDLNQLFLSTSQLEFDKKEEHYRKYFPIPGAFERRRWIETEQMQHAHDYRCGGGQGLKRRMFSFLDTVWPKSVERVSIPPKGIEGSLANVLTIISGNRKKVNLEDFEEYTFPDQAKIKKDASYENFSNLRCNTVK